MVRHQLVPVAGWMRCTWRLSNAAEEIWQSVAASSRQPVGQWLSAALGSAALTSGGQPEEPSPSVNEHQRQVAAKEAGHWPLAFITCKQMLSSSGAISERVSLCLD